MTSQMASFHVRLHKTLDAHRGCWRVGGLVALAALLLVPAGAKFAQATETITVGRLRVELERVVNALPFAPFPQLYVYMDTEAENPDRLYIATQNGIIRKYENDTFSGFLNIDAETLDEGPRGLLGFTFHPGYSDPGSLGYHTMYTFHSVPVPDPEDAVPVDFSSPGTVVNHNLVTEWKLCDPVANPSCTPGRIDLDTRREIFRQAHADNTGQGLHVGGMLEFGPDGYLYGHIGTPPQGAQILQAQDLSYINGKIFRIDPLDPSLTSGSSDPISANGNYRIPADNPFTDEVMYPTALDEVYASGMRNMYRFSIDPVSNMLFGGDVGNSSREEVSVVPAGGNMGWPHREGTIAGPIGGGTGPFVEPIGDYTHQDGRAVVGGYVYRGSIEALQGKYIFGEFSWGNGGYNEEQGRLLWMDPFDELGELKDPSELSIQELTRGESCSETFYSGGLCALDMSLYSFAIDNDGELYAIGFQSPGTPSTQVVYKFTDAYFLPVGDYNEDGTVDEDDYMVWRDAFGQEPGVTPESVPPPVRPGYGADGNRDGIIDAADYTVWRDHFGETILGSGSGSLSVPEPSTLSAAICLLVLGWGAGRSRRPRRG